MGIANGVQTKVIIGKETTWGVAAATNAGKTARRVSATIDLVKQTFRSNEIRTDHQAGKTRHGGISVEGSLQGELSCGTYQDIFAALLRAAWAAGSTTGAILVIAADSDGTFTRSTGSFVSDGFKVGDLINVSGFTSPQNNGRFVVSAVDALILTVTATTLVDEAEGDSVTILVPGKKLMIPASGHTNDSFTIEKLFEIDNADDVSELAVGCKFSTCEFGVTPDGLVTVSFGIMGKDMDSDSVAYFITPAAATTTEGMAGPQGQLLLDGEVIGTVTGFSFTIDGGMEAGAVVGSQFTPDIFRGPITISGSLDIYFGDNTIWTKYKAETDIAVVLPLTAPSGDTFVVKIPAITMTGNTKDDKATGGTIQTVPFEASRYVGSGNVESTTIVLQDSTLV